MPKGAHNSMRSRSIRVHVNCGRWLAVSALVQLTSPAFGEQSRFATNVVVRSDPQHQSSEVTVSFSAPPKFSARLERAARRLVIDVPDSEVKGAQESLLNK